MIDDRLTDAVLASLVDKSSRDPAVVQIYREHDFLTAYGLHTDRRVARDPHDAIGGLWNSYGALQRQFLWSRGLRTHSRLLDVGCGTGRLARQVVPWLAPGHYVGVDLSAGAVKYAQGLAESEGWAVHDPQFIVSQRLEVPGRFDFIWAFSVFIHLPAEEVEAVIGRMPGLLTAAGQFLFSYVPSTKFKRSGLKQFRHPWIFYSETARKYGLAAAPVEWPGLQRVAVMRRC